MSIITANGVTINFSNIRLNEKRQLIADTCVDRQAYIYIYIYIYVRRVRSAGYR